MRRRCTTRKDKTAGREVVKEFKWFARMNRAMDKIDRLMFLLVREQLDNDLREWLK